MQFGSSGNVRRVRVRKTALRELHEVAFTHTPEYLRAEARLLGYYLSTWHRHRPETDLFPREQECLPHSRISCLEREGYKEVGVARDVGLEQVLHQCPVCHTIYATQEEK